MSNLPEREGRRWREEPKPERPGQLYMRELREASRNVVVTKVRANKY